jgi:hypothetical protein
LKSTNQSRQPAGAPKVAVAMGAGLGRADPRLGQTQDLAAAELALRCYAERAERAVLSVGRGCYAVKAGKGKTELADASRLPARAGAPTVTCRFHVPASLVVLAPPGPRGHRNAFLPAFVADEKLRAVAARAVYKRQQFERMPLAQSCWPAHLKAQFLDVLLSQLPPAEAVEADRLARERARASRRRAWPPRENAVAHERECQMDQLEVAAWQAAAPATPRAERVGAGRGRGELCDFPGRP